MCFLEVETRGQAFFTQIPQQPWALIVPATDEQPAGG
jgi:hypothetical protein